jgi:hypothetical protein
MTEKTTISWPNENPDFEFFGGQNFAELASIKNNFSARYCSNWQKFYF